MALQSFPRLSEYVMTVEAASSNPSQLTEAERAAIEEQLERLLANRHFNHSRRFPAFLRFVVGKTLSASTDQLKERTLGVEIFGRNADYDTSSDPIVRVTAAEIRKRIAQYYQEPDHEDELRISLDAGSYVPQFHWPRESQRGSVSAVQAPEGVVLPVPHGVPVVEVARRPWRRARIAAGLLMVLALGGFGFAWRSLHQSPLDFFWGPLLRSNDPALLCLVDQPQTTNLAVDAQDPSRQVVVKTSMSAVNLDDLATIVRVGNVLLSHGKKYTLKGAGTTTLSDLRNGPTIFVGAFDNEWTMRLTKPLRFHFGNDTEFKHEWIADSTSTQAPAWFTQRPEQENANNYREFAIVARFMDPDTGQLCVIAAGIGQGSTLAAGEFLTDSTQLEQLQRMAAAAGNKKNIEAVISTQIIDGQPGTPKIEAAHFW
jgi:hypothetical protein